MSDYFFSLESVIRDKVGAGEVPDVFGLWVAVMDLRDEENQ